MRSFAIFLLLIFGLVLLGAGLWAALAPEGLLELFGATSYTWYGQTVYDVDPSVVMAGGIGVAVIGGVLTLIGAIKFLRKK